MTKRSRPKRQAASRAAAPRPAPPEGELPLSVRAHLRFGWWSLLVFLSLGALLEALHGFKIQLYLSVANETRRLLWTLAHAHGTLLSVIHIIFALTLPVVPGLSGRSRQLASRCLFGATVLLPGGFFLGGAFIHDGDPGLGILLVPPAVLLLVIAVFLVARGTKPSDPPAGR